MITQLGFGNADAANLVTNWNGTVYLLPLVGAYVADAHWGRYLTIIVFSIIYLIVTFFDFAPCHVPRIHALLSPQLALRGWCFVNQYAGPIRLYAHYAYLKFPHLPRPPKGKKQTKKLKKNKKL
jgi:hypothetical protein